MTTHTIVTYEEVCAMWANEGPALVQEPFSDQLLVKLVCGTNMIEDIFLSYNKTRELIRDETISGFSGNIRDLGVVASSNLVATSLNFALRAKLPLTTSMIKTLHSQLMYSGISSSMYLRGERAGEYKKHDYCVGRHDVGAAPRDVPRLMEELVNSLNLEQGGQDLLDTVSKFHCQFQNIHPFADGNGRLSRWLVNYLLLFHKHPPVVFESKKKNEYYAALEHYDETLDHSDMYYLMKKMVVSGLPSWRYLIG